MPLFSAFQDGGEGNGAWKAGASWESLRISKVGRKERNFPRNITCKKGMIVVSSTREETEVSFTRGKLWG